MHTEYKIQQTQLYIKQNIIIASVEVTNPCWWQLLPIIYPELSVYQYLMFVKSYQSLVWLQYNSFIINENFRYSDMNTKVSTKFCC